MSKLNNQVLSIAISQDHKARFPEMLKHFHKNSVSELIRYCLDVAYESMKDEVIPPTKLSDEVLPPTEVLPQELSDEVLPPDKWLRSGTHVDPTRVEDPEHLKFCPHM